MNKLPKTTKEDIQAWFNPDAYEEARHLNPAQWYAALDYRYVTIQSIKHYHWEKHPMEELWAKFDEFREPTIENTNQLISKRGYLWEVLAIGSISEITPSNAQSYAREGWKILAVNPTDNHPALVRAFKAWIETVPTHHSPHIKRRGIKADNIEFTKGMLWRWKDLQILSVLDFDIWSSIHQRKVISQANLIDLFKLKDPSARRWSENVREHCSQAFDYLPMLARFIAEGN